ncbi:radical SAM family heme chaperone HemW [Limimaricola sp. G21655-S1]|uniref:radical SAM family heme chaperone HemW n=1 Tax=Limimaricola sp. G21655-S1 TaxID=3014768 RepID=UPI0022AE80C2|nr:radical SAM family heme chaperone HemW [Limimaricola sp. G21655-S1]MCZ4261352.1 radical SAM family heme chaperone HemW [Limimaricola sp. G21655-S1]
MENRVENWQRGGFGLYLHWPFCQAKCPYCDFNSHVAQRIDQDRWAAAYLTELDRLAEETGDRILGSVFFGGGTPSLMEPRIVGAILDRISRHWRLRNDFEVTLEANPTSIEADRFTGYRHAGVNRVSMGMQALNDVDLRRLGRLHSVDEGLRAFDIARNAFDRISFDLIYARQDQSPEAWESELRRAMELCADHLSLYQLTVEEGTAFGDRLARGGLRGLPDEDRSAEMYEITQALTTEAGLPAYEISNHAVPGAESRHNLVYWRSGDWIGIGPGAHGRLEFDGIRYATEAPKAPGAWLSQVESGRGGEIDRVRLSSPEGVEERLMMGLRLAEGVQLPEKIDLLAEDFDRRVDALAELGLLNRVQDRLVASEAGRPILNGVLRELLT